MFEIIQRRRIEYEWISSAAEDPLAGNPRSKRALVFLHEGLGSTAAWKDFPLRCARAAGCDALVYSRYGYGNSGAIDSPRTPGYMHEEALQSLPDLLAKLGIERPILFGHSDGASIALIHAGSFPVAGIVALAPHLFVEQIALNGIRAIREHYVHGDLREKLARYHANPDSAFWGWHDIWLHPDFRSWDISRHVARIQAPVLAIQGKEDEYGTMLHLDRIAELVGAAEILKLENCRHSPHRDQPEKVIAATARFVANLNKPNGKETDFAHAT